MLITLSPSKGQDFEQAAPTQSYTIPVQLEDSQLLIEQLKKFTKPEIEDLMSISENLAVLNQQRYQDFQQPFNPQNAKQALFAFKGDVYSGINTSSMQQADFDYAQKHLRILSGLYGCLKPLDLIQPYRLEMKTKLQTEHGANLYQFWGDSITEQLNELLIKDKIIVNLASNEYWKSVKEKNINGQIINVAFKENKDGKSRIIAIFAKKARGMMADFLIRNRVETVDGIKGFDSDGYKFDAEISTEKLYIFSRKQPKPLSKAKKSKK
ncbi:MAG: peroxide stress protein YaaA [Alcanivoracaceae bacterium]|nr:peroxide stress protein YaaA [Alcanivoracaceae bacterium]